jgi:hypothetical protein
MSYFLSQFAHIYLKLDKIGEEGEEGRGKVERKKRGLRRGEVKREDVRGIRMSIQPKDGLFENLEEREKGENGVGRLRGVYF